MLAYLTTVVLFSRNFTNPLATRLQHPCSEPHASSIPPLYPKLAASSTPLWLRNLPDGWRTKYFLGGFTPSTNYTAFIIQDSHKVSGPINFLTKSASFACTLIHALLFCPSTIYALPLPAPPNTELPIYDSSTLPTEISIQLIGVLNNFTTPLTISTCGRDWYSPLAGCDEGQREYYKWLCTTISPRGTNQAPQSGTHTSVDRACPPLLGFLRPSVMFNGESSYGFGYIDGAEGDERGGVAGVGQDRWGNIWCDAG
ncbi:hypothetical protein P691DRAFT_787313 [Macrolepiota fuliginosa MF-IS2]|uniref:Uncharacterized protein n=1 Tax=Macrolepiota fuliginosa MF-IS2 TaxID=1400762 RepID=A0A9P6BY91_9AGAR|nr:hypothetical protein P691DRAFT_787313 [Macrolepiota fuliginosa MF-IS2]